jgi:hypothetical protein
LGAPGVGSGITDFDGLMDDAVTRSPLHRLGKPEDVVKKKDDTEEGQQDWWEWHPQSQAPRVN